MQRNPVQLRQDRRPFVKTMEKAITTVWTSSQGQHQQQQQQQQQESTCTCSREGRVAEPENFEFIVVFVKRTTSRTMSFSKFCVLGAWCAFFCYESVANAVDIVVCFAGDLHSFLKFVLGEPTKCETFVLEAI